jgi:DNA repair protein RadC
VKIKQLPNIDRPREKLKSKGPSSLSDFELLAAIYGSGSKTADVTVLAHQTLKLIKAQGIKIGYKDLENIKGLGAAKISELLAAFELAKRNLTTSDQPLINSIEAALTQLEDIRNKKQEYFDCLSLDGANRLLAKRVITIGTLDSSLSHPREVFADVITDRAANIILGHNHPSGLLKPSQNDIEVTRRLSKSGKLLGIRIIDHLIVGRKGYFSFAKSKLLE